MQLSFKERTARDLREGDEGVLERIDLPADDAQRLMEVGFVPGLRIVAAGSAPGGCPRVYRVDGAEFALRCETAERLILRTRGGDE
ncbi:MAG: FeoA family protein [Bryobacteraceae bacterium]